MVAAADRMTDGERCLTCRHGAAPTPNREIEERAMEKRYGPNAALGGACEHPKRPGPANSKFWCADFTAQSASPEPG